MGYAYLESVPYCLVGSLSSVIGVIVGEITGVISFLRDTVL